MKYFLVLLVLFLAACNQTFTPNVSLQPQDFGTSGNDVGTAVAANATGVYVAGYSNGLLDGPRRGGDDAFIRKYDGGVLWANQFGTSSSERAWRLVVDSVGNSYVFGDTRGTFTFSKGGADCFLRKYDPDGTVLWTRQTGRVGGDRLLDAVIDSNNNLYTLCNNTGTTDVIRKWNSDGQVLLTITFPSATLADYPRYLAVDSRGSIFLVTSVFIESTNSFRGGSQDILFYQYTSSGVPVTNSPRIFSVSDPNWNESPRGVKLDSSDNFYVLVDRGVFLDPILLKADVAANTLWSQDIYPSTDAAPEVFALALGDDENVYVGGTASYAPDFSQNYEGFVVGYDAEGNRLWDQRLATPDNDVVFGLAVSDALYATGFTTGSPNLVGDPAYGGQDAFLARLEPATGTILGIDQ